MDIAEVIIQDARRQGVEETEQRLTHKFEESQRLAVFNLQKENFSNERIAEILNISVDELIRITESK